MFRTLYMYITKYIEPKSIIDNGSVVNVVTKGAV